MDTATKIGSGSKLGQGRTRTQARTPSKKKYQIKVDILAPDGSIIKHGIDIKALRRFSNAAKPKIPIHNTTEDIRESTISYTFMPVGLKLPVRGAITGLTTWMEDRKLDDYPDLLRADDIRLTRAGEEKKLEMLIHILASCYAFKTPFGTELLVQDVERMMRATPLKQTELQAVWELLPHGHRLVRAAAGSLTHFFQTGKLDKEENDRIEEYFVAEPIAPKLRQLFDAEEKRFLSNREERLEASRGRRVQSGVSRSSQSESGMAGNTSSG